MLALLAAATTLAAACGGDDGDSASSAEPSGDTEQTTSAIGTSATGDATASATGTGAGTGTVTAEAQAAIDRAFLTENMDTSSLDPTIVRALTIASKPLTEDQEALLFECLDQQTCEIGDGELTIGLAETNGVNGLRRMWRLEGTAQALAHPEVGKVVYLDAHGDLQTFLSNFRSLISQKVDIIIGSFDLGEAVLPVVREATEAGIIVVPYGQIIPGAKAPDDYALYVGNDNCTSWKAEAETAVAQFGEGQRYGLYTGPAGNPYFSVWQPCVEEVLKAHDWEQVISGNTDWTPQGEQQAGAALIASGEDLDVIFYDYNAEGLVQPFLDADETPPAIFAQSNDAAYWKLYQDARAAGHDFPAYVAAVGSWSFRVAVTAAVDRATGVEVADEIILPTKVAQLADLLDYYDPELPALTPMLPLTPTDWVVRVLS